MSFSIERLTWLFIKYFLWIYGSFTVIYFVFMFTLAGLIKVSKPGTKSYTLFCRGIAFGGLFFAPTLAFPLVAIRPRHPKNASILSWFIRKASYLAGFTWELRGEKHARHPEGAIICANHQDALDIFGDMNVGHIFERRGAVSKKELFYVFPFGPICWLSNIIFIDRTNPKAIRKTLERLTEVTTVQKIKILFYPEGTRSGGTKRFLPFRKGAFMYAIKAQVPIIPMVFAPYYFIEPKTRVYLYENSK